jgi:hypothetical protein
VLTKRIREVKNEMKLLKIEEQESGQINEEKKKIVKIKSY